MVAEFSRFQRNIGRTIPAVLLFIFVAALACGEEKKIVRYGLVPDFPPTTFLDEQGNPTGFYIELFTRIMEELGYEPEYVVGPFPKIYEMILADEIDLFSSLMRTEEREDLLYWPSEPTFVGWGEFFVSSNRVVKGILELEGKDIGLVPGDANGENFTAYMAELDLDFNPVRYDNFDDLISAVRADEVFGGIAGNTLVLGKAGIQGSHVVFSPTNAYTTCAATNLGAIPYVEEFNVKLGILKEDPESYYWDLYDKWMSTERIETTVFPSWLLWIIVLLAAAIVAFVIFNQVLKAQVDSRTKELLELNEDLESRVTKRTKDLEDAHEQLMVSEKAGLTSRLVSGVAHQINTPLGIATTSLSFLRSQIESLVSGSSEENQNWDADSINQAMELLENNLSKSAELVRVFQNLSPSRDDAELQTIQLDDFVKKFIVTLQSEFKKAGCSYDLDLSPVVVSAPPGALSITIAHLVMNALRHGYAEKAGVVTIRVGMDGDSAALIVEDQGQGIPGNKLSGIFDAFYTTGTLGGKAGLGLTIVQNTVRNSLKGQIRAEANPGEPTRFIIQLPVEE